MGTALVALGFLVSQPAPVAGARPGAAARSLPLVTLVTPVDGTAVNAATLHVHALAAAFEPHRKKRFFFGGREVAGTNAGRLRSVELALDGSPVARMNPKACRGQLAAAFQVDLSALAPGPHTLTVTAHQASGRRRTQQSASATFYLDPALPFAEVRRLERAATPHAFSCFAARSRQKLRRGLRLAGTFALGQLSDGIDLAQDRLVVALGSRVTAVEPGGLRCRKTKGGRRTCRYEQRSRPLIQRIKLVEEKHGRWRFEIAGGPLAVEIGAFLLRIGNDWGGVDLTTGAVLAGLRPDLDTSRRAEAVIGPAGGVIETTDASGVVIRLDVPPAALPADTRIAVTPLLTSPLPDSSTALHPGVAFEPEGLHFAQPAALVLDFGATGRQVGDHHFVSLLTSPLSAVPLFGEVDPDRGTLSAVLHHFSQVQAGAGNSAYLDFVAWGDAILDAGRTLLTVTDIQDLLALLRVQNRAGCSTQSCVDPQALERLSLTSLDVLVGAACTPEVLANPSDDSFARLLEIERLLFEFLPLGPGDGPFRDCLHDLLQELIEQARAEAQTDPTVQHLERLLDLTAEAGSRDLDDLRTLAFQGLAAALRSLLDEGEQLCRTDADVGRVLLERARQFETTDATDLAAVDPTLGNDIQSALNECGIPAMTATVITEPFATGARAFPNSCGPEEERVVIQDILPAATAPPVFLAAQAASGEQVQFSVLEPDPNVLAWDLAGTSTPTGVASGVVGLTLDFSGAGTLKAEINPAWGSGEFDPHGLVVQPAPFQLRVDLATPTATVEVPGATTVAFLATIQVGRLTCGMQDVVPGSGSGRLLTITFTPFAE